MTNNKSQEFSADLQELANFARILSHPARIAIIQLLSKKHEIKTGDISEFLPISRTTVSQHLKELKNAGIIQGNINGLKIHYCLNEEKLLDNINKLNGLINDCCCGYKCEC